ncbi:kinase-like domain-containing protein [Aspergillus cavernicola]|uniref:Kinase-like domain-containing protein n=1 Tax=Aspergillus cavernicola TaxID=176166 RepID=A0ABR4HVL8_9EURO
MSNKLSTQPESYKKKPLYRFGRALGAGTYSIVREADCVSGKIAVKIPKNNKMSHPHIVHFVDWFESKDKFYIVTQLTTGGELLDSICEYGKFTEKDASQTIHQVLDAVNYLHQHDIVHRDFGSAKMLGDSAKALISMEGFNFDYTAPEVLLKQAHGKAVDIWSLGVITYTLLCGYPPFRSENLTDLIQECSSGRVIFHDLLQVSPAHRPSSKEALKHPWLDRESASNHNLPPEIRAYIARSRLKRGIEIIKLAHRINALKIQKHDDKGISGAVEVEGPPGASGNPVGAESTLSPVLSTGNGNVPAQADSETSGMQNRSLSKSARGAVFQVIVLAKICGVKENDVRDKVEREARVRTQS